MKKVLSIVAIALFLFSCGNKAAEIKKLSDEVLKIHDEVMPKMQDLANLKKDFLAISDSTLDSLSRISVAEEVAKLEKADEKMMQWMREYNGPAAEASDAEKVSYYQTELDKINAVKTETEAAIDNAKKELEKHAK